MPLIPESLKVAIKRDVSCVAVLESRGRVFVRHGNQVATNCPFHGEDATPSLLVSEGKNEWNCRACGKGGDVIRLVQELDRVGFRRAVELIVSGHASALSSCGTEIAAFQAGAGAGAGAGQAGAGGPGAGSAGRPLPRSQRITLPCPLDVTADDARLSQQVVDCYHARLREGGADHPARAYLRRRGLDDGELIRRFSLGWSDRSLGMRLPDKAWKAGADLRGRLQRLGWFRPSGHEHFAGSIVVPILGAGLSSEDHPGQVVGCYGRKVGQGLRPGSAAHTYLPGKHRGIWNAGPELVNGDGAVVVCEALLDAMTLWVHGFHHVTASYGVNGFTADHLAALRHGRATDVFIAYDADAAGDVAADALADQMIAAGFTAWRVRFPPGEDVNDLAVSAGTGAAEELRQRIAGAQWLGGSPRVTVPAGAPAAVAASDVSLSPPPPAAPPPVLPPPAPASPVLSPGLALRRTGSGDEWQGTLGTRHWRVRGLGKATPSALVVAVRVVVEREDGPRFHLDKFDLYQHRSRQAFTGAAAAVLEMDPEVIASDLGRLVLALELAQAEAGRTPPPGGGSAAGASDASSDPASLVPSAVRDQALAILTGADPLERIVGDLGACGLVGEETNKRAAVLAVVSRLLDTPLALLVQSSSAAGKTTLMDAVLGFIPPEGFHRYSAVSGRSLFYQGPGALRRKVLAIAEEEGARRAAYSLKLLQSDGYLVMSATIQDPQTGRLETKDHRVEGPVMLFLTSTAIDLDAELVNRCLVLTVDESPEQTRRIHAAQRQAATAEGLRAKGERQALAYLHQQVQRLLRPLPVVIPPAIELRFASGSSRLRRDFPKLLTLVKASALLHQYQRPVVTMAVDGAGVAAGAAAAAGFASGAAASGAAAGESIAYIEATEADAAIARSVAGALFGRSLDDLPPQTRSLWDALRQHTGTVGAATGQPAERVPFTRRQAQGLLGWSYGQARIHLDRLVAMDYVVEVVRPGQVTTYRIVAGIGDDRPASVVPPSDATAAAASADLAGQADQADQADQVGGEAVEPPGTTRTLQGSAGVCRGVAGVVGANLPCDEIRDDQHEMRGLQGKPDPRPPGVSGDDVVTEDVPAPAVAPAPAAGAA